MRSYLTTAGLVFAACVMLMIGSTTAQAESVRCTGARQSTS